MRDADSQRFFTGLRKAISHSQLYPADHPYTTGALAETAKAVGVLTEEDGRAVVSAIDRGIYLNKRLLPQASIEFGGLLHIFETHGIESITFNHPVVADDVGDLIGFLAGSDQDLPAGGTITLNDRPFTRADLLEAAGLSSMRRSYASSLDILRGVAIAASEDQEFDINPASEAVGELLETVLAQHGASVLLASIKAHDQYTFFHSVNVAILALALGKSLGFDRDMLTALGAGALLHDVGKVKVSPSIIQYPGRLDSHQWAEIKLHPQEGAQAILAASGHGQELAARVALEHHAGYDLCGYPPVDGRTKLHLFSRIVAICDIYDAMTTRRSYKRAEPPAEALRVILSDAGMLTDPQLAQAFVSMMGILPVGSLLRLDGGETVMVVDPHGDGRPTSVVVRDAAGRVVDPGQPSPLDEGRIADLLLPEQVGIQPAALLEDLLGQAA